MARGVRIDPADVDLDSFRAFIDAMGAVHDRPRDAGSEVLRFRIGGAFGLVSRRLEGSLTFAGIAKPLLGQMTAGAAAVTPPRLPARVVIQQHTFKVDQYAEARELLAGVKRAEVYSDGSCEHGGIGRGGWAAVIRGGFVNVEIYGGARSTTVNRMEMIAAIAALQLLPATAKVRVKTDSQYLRKGIKQWIAGWKRRGWMTTTGTPVKNVDLWKRLDATCAGRAIAWKWVRGHSGDRLNERADELARLGRLSINPEQKDAAA